jgi:CO dehydrogenase/acetyl-CoA synthase epsilon subunit
MWATKKVDAAVAAYHEMVKKAKHPLVSDLVVGDKVLNDMADRANGQTWQTVTDIVITDKACGWSVKGDVKTAWAFRTIVTLSDGSTHDVASNQIVRRHCGRIDITPFLEMAGI